MTRNELAALTANDFKLISYACTHAALVMLRDISKVNDPEVRQKWQDDIDQYNKLAKKFQIQADQRSV